AGGKAAIDDELQPLPDREDGGRGEQQRSACENHLLAVRPQEAADAGERLQRRHRRQLGRVQGNRGVGSGHVWIGAVTEGASDRFSLTLDWRRSKVEPGTNLQENPMPPSP